MLSRTHQRVFRRLAQYCRDGQRDAGHAVRLLSRAPGFTLASVLCLAIGTGLTAAMYSQVQSTMLADLPGAIGAPDALIRISRPVSGPDYEELREGTAAFAQLAGYIGPVPITLQGGNREQPSRVWGQLVTPNYFEVLQIRAASGRLFSRSEPSLEATSVVLSDRLWRRRFAADPTVPGKAIRVNGQVVTVIGVAPAGFAGASPMTGAADLWIATTASAPLAPELHTLQRRDISNLEVVGRLAPGVSSGRAELALVTVAHRIQRAHGDPEHAVEESSIRVVPGGRMFPVRNEDLPRAIGFPLVLVSLVLLMACGNVANMTLARGVARYREFAVRLAVGAGRGRVARQLVTESLLLSALGSAGGAFVALGLLSLFERMRVLLPAYVHYEVDFHWRAYLAATAVATLSTVGFSLAASLRAGRVDIQTALKPNSTPALRGRRLFGLRNLVIYQQVTLSVVLILLTGFVVVGWNRAAGVDLGFDPAQLYFVSVDPVREGLTAEGTEQVVGTLQEGLAATPGVAAVSVAQTSPLAMSSAELLVGARTNLAAGTSLLGTIRVDRVGAGFFETVGTPLVRGRTFSRSDQSMDSRVVVVNESLARRVWPGANAVGQPLKLGSDTWEVIGVVADLRSAFPLAPVPPAVYQPVTTAGYASPSKHGVTLIVRGFPGTDLTTRLDADVRTIAPELAVVDVTPVTREVDQALFLARVATYTYGGMGVLGLILAAAGLAGVTAYAVARRTREIGIRMALGAQRSHVLWLVLREGMGLVLAGTVSGLVVAVVLTRALATVVEALAETTRTSMSDPRLLIGGPGLLVLLALMACYVPARRSMRIDPITALRSE
jgi:predicted permease